MSSKPGSSLKVIGIVFTFIGVLMLAVAVFLFVIGTNAKKGSIKVPATISNIISHTTTGGKEKYTVLVDYEFDGRQFKDSRLGYYNSGMEIGDVVDVYINPDKAYDINPMTEKYSYIIPVVLGVVFGGIGLGVLISSRQRGSKELMQTGEPVEAIVTKCGRSNVEINGRSTYRVHAEYTDSMGMLRTIKTPLMYFDPTAYVEANGRKITVYVDPNNPKKYYIDTESMSYVNEVSYANPQYDSNSFNDYIEPRNH